MKHRLLSLALGAGLAIGVSAPMTAPANAFACSELAQPVCAAYALVCSFIPDSGKVNLHNLLCESFA